MLCIPKSNHKKLIDDCYPPPKQIGNIGPEYKANSNELSRLAYYGNRKPAKLTKVGDVLVLRAQLAAKGVGGSGQAADKAKGSLMVTLAMTKELITECHSNINYFASAAASIITTALQAAAKAGPHGSRDIDITARSAGAFYALANYLNSSSSSMDANASKKYMTLLSYFGRIAQEDIADPDTRSRVRLLGVGALAGAVGSDVFFSPTQSEQLSYIAPALIANFDNGAYDEINGLREEAHKIADKGIASNTEYAAKRRPVNARKVPAFSVDPEKSPSALDVASAAMGTVHTALQNGEASHVQGFVSALLDFCNGKTGASRQWTNRAWCSWIADAFVSWTALPYRFTIPTALIDNLVDDSDAPSEDRHITLISMVTTLLSSKYSMIGLSTSDTANDLLGYAVRRVHHDAKDPVLVPLVRCIGALGTHVYYADQINDLAEEITARIATLEMPQGDDRGAEPVAYSESKSARESIRMLLACMLMLMKTAQKSSGNGQSSKAGPSGPASPAQKSNARNRISTSVWQQTASLLASPDHSVRLSFQEALLTFFEHEIAPASLTDGQSVVDSLSSKQSTDATGFTHSFSAALYVLMLSKELHAPTSLQDSPLEALPIIDRANKERSSVSGSSASAALPLDYSAVIRILDSMYERIPVAAVLGTVPALLALDKSSATMATGARKEAISTVVQSAMNKIGDVCGVSSVKGRLPKTTLPAFPAEAGAQSTFFSDDVKASSRSVLSASSVVSSLAGSQALQGATDLDAATLQQWFARDWSVQIAVDDSFIGASPSQLPDDNRLGVASERSRGGTPARASAGDRSASNVSAAAADARGGSLAGRMSVDEFRSALGTHGNGGLDSFDGVGLEKRTSRRASRKAGDANGQATSGLSSKGTKSGPALTSVSGLLDSMKVGLPEEDEPAELTNGNLQAKRSVKAPYMP